MERQTDLLVIQEALSEGNADLAVTKLKLLYEEAIAALKAGRWEECESMLRRIRCVPEGRAVFDEYRGRANATIELLPLIRGKMIGTIREERPVATSSSSSPGQRSWETAELAPSYVSEPVGDGISEPSVPLGPRPPRKL